MQLEERILQILSTSEGKFLENEVLINSLTESKKTSQEIEKKLRQSTLIYNKISQSRQNFRGVSNLAALQYSFLQEIHKLCKMYQFSLQWFQQQFKIAIEEAGKCKNLDERT